MVIFDMTSCENCSSNIAQLTFTCSNSTIETLKKGAKYVQS